MQTDNRTRSLYFSDSITRSMNSIFDYPLTIIEAPMGYGKTTAVREQLAKSNANILLQRIFDNSTDSFWKAFCRLFSTYDSDGSVNLEQLGFPNDGVSSQESLKLIEDFKLPAKTVLVLDDFHLLNRAEVSRFIEFLVVNEIENLNIVLIARYIEFPGMDELALKGYLYHIDKEAFELGPNEIIKYYRLCGINLKDTEAEKLYALTEGWISALYLMMLNYRESGGFDVSSSIYGLVENTIYNPFSEEIKEFLLALCHFDSFTMGQAVFIWGNEHAREYLSEVTEKNAFVNYDPGAGTYQMHNIFTSLLKEMFAGKAEDFKKAVYEKAGHWYVKADEYLTAMHYFYSADDFDNLLMTVELDKGYCFGNEQKELVIRYFEECPVEIKQRHPVALLHYALTMMTFNETGLFQKICEEFVNLIQNSNLGTAVINRLMGEFELILSFTRYNDIMGMSEHFNKAWELLNGPSDLMDTKSNWTFGSPSVLYMFYRESGKLADEVNEMHAAMPYYYRLANGHGMGAECLMEAEWFLNRCDYQNAEITAYKALYRAESALQPNMVLCAQFILARLALIKGEYISLVNLLREMHDKILEYKAYELIHTVDMCIGYAYACLQQSNKIPEWLARGDFNSSRLLFPSMAFSNIVYGRALLIKGDYTKLLGVAGQFVNIASVFPNILANLYTTIHIAAANERIFRRVEAVEAMKQALDMSIPDKMYLPFVENFDYINPLLETLYSMGIYREDIVRIQELSAPYQRVMEQIKKEFLNGGRPKLTAREAEIALLAAEGYSNKGIGERLYITQNTVKTQLKNVFEKLGINSRSLLKQHMDSN